MSSKSSSPPHSRGVLALRHLVFWPGFGLEFFSQLVALPAVWFLLKNAVLHFDTFNPTHPGLPSLTEFLLTLALYLLSCVRLISVFGYWKLSPNLMKIYCVSSIIWLAQSGLLMTIYFDHQTISGVFTNALFWLLIAHTAIAVYVLSAVSKEEKIEQASKD